MELNVQLKITVAEVAFIIRVAALYVGLVVGA
jgi:hypothetical protein